MDSLTCAPLVSWTGTPSITDPNPFEIRANGVQKNKSGLFFYGYQAAALPFQGGTLCVQPPLKRTPITNAGGGGANCSGTLLFDFNAWIPIAIFFDPDFMVGKTVFGQFWYRDPAGLPFPVGLSNVIRFQVQL